MHEIDHREGKSFAFVLLTPSRDRTLGCVYLNPRAERLSTAGSARVTFWIRQDSQHTDLPAQVAAEVSRWIRYDWPLDAHLVRVLPTEEPSVAALEVIGCRRVEFDLPGESRPYLWFAPPEMEL